MISQQQLEELLAASPRTPLDEEIADMNWSSAMRFGRRCADRSWRAGFVWGGVVVGVVAVVGVALARL